MILLLGVGSDPCIASAKSAADAEGLACAIVDQRRWHACALEVWMGATGEVQGTLTLGSDRIDLAEVSGVLVRLIDPSELSDVEPSRCIPFHDRLASWLEIAPGRICNRATASASNISKPYQQQLINEAGLLVPETLVTNSPDDVRAFAELHGRVIYKSASCVRSVVQELSGDRLAGLDAVRSLPTQFQAMVQGADVRVHVVGADVFATEITSVCVDYRYPVDDQQVEMRTIELPLPMQRSCIALADALDLPLCGIDFKRTDHGEFVCLEVNPAPAFACFEEKTNQPIARAIAKYLGAG